MKGSRPAIAYFLRHGETEWNVQRRMQGWMDSPLTPLGVQQARMHGEVLKREGVHNLIASDLGRVRETARHLQEVHSIYPNFDERLREVQMGDWEGMEVEQLRTQHYVEFARRSADMQNVPPPNGESLSDMRERVQPLLWKLGLLEKAGVDEYYQYTDSEVVHAPRDGSVAILSHGLMTRVILQAIIQDQDVPSGSMRILNSLIYRIDFRTRPCAVSYFLDGEGPFQGFYKPNL